ncbi:hypothetical protein V8G69_08450 [Gaetbulibacter sp. M235]|uniref:TolB family protein n=1 Tax=Gaetbulibacter sp. M235 TaxID=3126510 RepID=UPI00374EEA9F
MNSDGSNVIQLTFSNTYNTDPTFSPDRSWIAFNSERDGNSEIYLMKPDGTRQMRLTQNTYYDERPDWSPDGLNILFSRRFEQ